jgi:segregation and condensation protein A
MNNKLHISFPTFDGPLDLLLSLIDDKKMEISEVSISAVTERFIAYLETLEEQSPEELGDFLVVATRLLFIKSKKLLSSFEPEEEEVSLEEQLRIYRLFVEVSKKIQTRWMDTHRGYLRYEPPRIPAVIPLPENLTIVVWTASITRLLHRLKPPKALPETRIDRSISLKETITRLKQLLEVEDEVGFSRIVGDKASKTEVIMSFLALLELVKQREIHLSQDTPFMDIMLKKI